MGTYPDWFDPKGAVAPNGGPSGPGTLSRTAALGVYSQTVQVGDQAGLQITQVVSGGTVHRVGLEAGDVILETGGEPSAVVRGSAPGHLRGRAGHRS